MEEGEGIMVNIPTTAQAAAAALLAAIQSNAEKAAADQGSQSERNAYAATAAKLGEALDAVARLLAASPAGDGGEGGGVESAGAVDQSSYAPGTHPLADRIAEATETPQPASMYRAAERSQP